MRTSHRCALAVSLLVFASLACGGGLDSSSAISPPAAAASATPALSAGKEWHPPQGIYVHLPIDRLVTYPSYKGQWYSYLYCYFQGFLSNTAVSGLEISVGWGEISYGPGQEQNDWSYLDAGFDAVKDWNKARAPGTPAKTIQLIVVPGFKSPGWLLHDDSLIVSCDRLFSDRVGKLDCGKVTIHGYTEGGNTGTIWPLPWDNTYKQKWNEFLGWLSDRYGGRDEFVSIAMGGPTGTSDEMYIPHYNVGDIGTGFGDPEQTYGANQLPINGVIFWLIANWAKFPHDPSYRVTPGTEDVFVTEWGETVKAYEQIFHKLTLILTPAKGGSFPDDWPVQPITNPIVTVPPAVQPIFDALCREDETMSCATTAEIMEQFKEHSLANGNGKGSQMSGLGRNEKTDFGIRGVRYLAEVTKTEANPLDQIIGGAQFAHAYSVKHTGECPGKKKNKKGDCPVEEAEDYVFGAAFDKTDAACFFGDRDHQGSEPLNFLQIFYKDFEYASEESKCPDKAYDSPFGPLWSLQDLFAHASLMLQQTSLPQVSPPLSDCEPPLENSCVPAEALPRCEGLMPPPCTLAQDCGN